MTILKTTGGYMNPHCFNGYNRAAGFCRTPSENQALVQRHYGAMDGVHIFRLNHAERQARRDRRDRRIVGSSGRRVLGSRAG